MDVLAKNCIKSMAILASFVVKVNLHIKQPLLQRGICNSGGSVMRYSAYLESRP